VIAGCAQTSAMRNHVRQYDFREANRQKLRQQAAPSPIANVFDMPGWTSDLEGATAFARVNDRRTVVFIRRDAEGDSDRMVRVLNSRSVEQALAASERVSVDIAAAPSVASSLGVSQTPALVVLDPSGRPLSRTYGVLTQSQILAATQ
jgi:glucose/arabinose dehydrogenase